MDPASPADPADLVSVLRTLTSDPGRPRLTWYGPAGERVELSGHVLDNWVTKTTNLLVEEHDAGPGTTVVLDLPPHWRAVVWALATWRCGAHLVLGPDADVAADLVLTHRPAEHDAAVAPVLAVALPSLARTFGEPLPAGVEDATSAALSFGDALGWVPPTDPSAAALTTGDGATVPHAGLAAWWARGDDGVPSPAGPGERRLVEASGPELAPVLAAALRTWAADGSVVVCSPEATAELAADPDRRRRLLASERVTAPDTV